MTTTTQGTPRMYFCECLQPIVGIIRWRAARRSFTEWHAGTLEDIGRIVTNCPACGAVLPRFLSDRPGAKTVAATMLHRFASCAQLQQHVCGQEVLWMYSFPSRGWNGQFYAVEDPGGPALKVCPKCGRQMDGHNDTHTAGWWELDRERKGQTQAAPTAAPGGQRGEIKRMWEEGDTFTRQHIMCLAARIMLQGLADKPAWNEADEERFGLICGGIRAGNVGNGPDRVILIGMVNDLLIAKKCDQAPEKQAAPAAPDGLDMTVWGSVFDPNGATVPEPAPAKRRGRPRKS